jgi:negative regulator of sigma-B (phosphoserine phosphatase)
MAEPGPRYARSGRAPVTAIWGAVVRAKQGQSVSGDVYIVEEIGNVVLSGVIDGLGGGEDAARAANLAVAAFKRHRGLPLQDLIKLAHADLHATRGAVVGLLRLDQASSQLSYIGVGNIGINVYSRRAIKPISKNGILGFRLPTLLELHYTYDQGDVFVLYSDGISSQFTHDLKIDLALPPQQIAERILAGYGKATDDATVLVVKT